jgi:5-methylcytosine-specific restriction endonuclease McrA
MDNLQERNNKILEMYYNGSTFEIIGKTFNISRARAQQILAKRVEQKILDDFDFDIKSMSKDEKSMLRLAASEEIRETYLERNKKKVQEETEKILEKVKKLPDYSNFISTGKYANALGVSLSNFRALLPDIYHKILNKNKRRWSWYYDKCRSCGTTAIKHRSNGLCEKCYTKSDDFKNIAESSRIRNKDKWKKKQDEYRKEYYKRDEVKEKFKTMHDLRNFGGNREKALVRDNYKCQDCGMPQKKSFKIYNRDLYVAKLDGKNTDLNNLITLCRGCSVRRRLKNYKIT